MSHIVRKCQQSIKRVDAKSFEMDEPPHWGRSEVSAFCSGFFLFRFGSTVRTPLEEKRGYSVLVSSVKYSLCNITGMSPSVREREN